MYELRALLWTVKFTSLIEYVFVDCINKSINCTTEQKDLMVILEFQSVLGGALKSFIIKKYKHITFFLVQW